MKASPSTIAAAPVDSQVSADQAVFTSVRSRTGGGYRIVAASPGVTAVERAEITRRSPSHGGLCDDATSSGDAVSCYALPEGRVCVALSRAAGREYSGRGGTNVLTHAVILDTAGWARFGCHAVRAAEALRAASAGLSLDELPARLERLTLNAAAEGGTSRVLDENSIVMLQRIVDVLLSRRAAVVDGRETTSAFLEVVLDAIPLFARRELAVSVGLKHSTSRRMDLVILTRADAEARRGALRAKVEWIEPGAERVIADSPYARWLKLAGRCLRTARAGTLRRLSQRVTEGATQASRRRLS